MTHELYEAELVVKVGRGGRIVNPVYLPPDKTVHTAPRSNFIRLNSSDTVRTRSLFNGIALEYLYTRLISPWFSENFKASGHGGMIEALTENYKKVMPPWQRSLMDDGVGFDSDACNEYMRYNRLFERENFTHESNETKDKGQLGWLRKIRVVEESVRDSAPTYTYEDDGLIFPARYCFDVSFPVKGNEGIILLMRMGGMVKQRDGVNHHMI